MFVNAVEDNDRGGSFERGLSARIYATFSAMLRVYTIAKRTRSILDVLIDEGRNDTD